MAMANAGLLARVRIANERLEGLASGQDRREAYERARARAEKLDSALSRLNEAYVAGKELRTKTKASIELPSLTAPKLEDATPSEWFDSGVALDYVENVQTVADELAASVQQAWSRYCDDLEPSLLPSAMVDLLRGASEELDAACDELESAIGTWKSLPAVLPSPGDVSRARAAKAKVDGAWESLSNSGATRERIEFLQRVGQRGVPLAALEDDLLSWLRSVGLASRLVIKSA